MSSALTKTDVDAFRHEAFFYADDMEYVGHASAFITEGVDAGEAVLVAVPQRKVDLLREALGLRTSGSVRFTDITKIGLNPLRMIPMWRDFVDEHGTDSRPVRGIGEPIWAERTASELVEAHRHEALINLAFAGAPAWILCPYDLASLAPDVITEAHRTHPLLVYDGATTTSDTYAGLDAIDRPFDAPLPEPPAQSQATQFMNAGDLRAVRSFVGRYAESFGVASKRASELVLTVNELVTNSLRHAGSSGTVRAWIQDASLVVEVRDHGRIFEPLIGRMRPPTSGDGGFGLWIVNQLCDLVEIRTYPSGSVVRLHVGLGITV